MTLIQQNPGSEPVAAAPFAQQESEAELWTLLDDPMERKSALVKLAELCRREGRVGEAAQLVETYINEAATPDELAFGSLGRGLMAEAKGAFMEAAFFYRLGLEYPCKEVGTQYFLLNNLGFSLNQLGRFVEAQEFCRRAIELEVSRGNAYKNLGLSLKGQGRLLEAARIFSQGMNFCPAEMRNLMELTNLHRENPGLLESDLPTWGVAKEWLTTQE